MEKQDEKMTTVWVSKALRQRIREAAIKASRKKKTTMGDFLAEAIEEKLSRGS